jgi:DNA-binding transcriptional LysR family regulator
MAANLEKRNLKIHSTNRNSRLVMSAESSMDPRKLRLFITLADELNYGRAADRVGVTQSVLSVQIQRLEDEVGAQLFHRTTRQVSLTAAGKGLRAEATAILARIDQARRSVRALAAGSGRLLRIGFTTPIGLADIPRIVADFRVARPDVEVVLREMGTVDQEAALAAGDIDVGFLHPPLDQSGLTLETFGSYSFGACRGADAQLASESLDWVELLDEPIVFYSRRRAPRLYDAFIASAWSHGVSPRIVAEAETFLSAIAMAASGLGVALVPCALANVARASSVWSDIADCPLTLVNAMAFPKAFLNDPLNTAILTALKIETR